MTLNIPFNLSFFLLKGCFGHCSYNGFCNISAGDFKCSCLEHFTGESCEIDMRPCSNFLTCRHNAKCENIFDQVNQLVGFDCNCTEPFYGKRCENKREICRNVSCNHNGKCRKNGHTPICKFADFFLSDL